MNKIAIISIAVVLAIIAAMVILIMPPSATAAILYVESGTVEVDQGKGWQQATNEMQLDAGDHVRTTDGEATLILLEGEVMELEPNTEVVLDKISKEKISITQKSGETWNKVTKISGVKEYEVTTPTTVATVRGTEFLLGNIQMDVMDGNVEFERKSDKKKMMVGALKKAMANNMTLENMTEKDMAKMNKFKSRMIARLERTREKELNKHRIFLRFAEKNGYNEQQMRSMLKDVDDDKMNEDKLYDQVPSPLKPRAERTYRLTKAIKQLKNETRGTR